MSAQSLHKTTPLVWLRAEIERSIDAARESLGRARARSPQSQADLHEAAGHVRQVRGALEMLELRGAARFCRALEEAQCAAADTGQFGERPASTMDRALFALRQFLLDVAQGEPDMPLKLFPVYREVSELRGRPSVSEAELFFPDLGAAETPSAAAAPAMPASTRQAHRTACCTLFQRGLVSWLRTRSRTEGIGMMRSAIDGMSRAADDAVPDRSLWQAAGGLIDVLAHPDERVDPVQTRSTLAKIERAMNAIASGTPPDTVALMQDILYPVAVARPVSERVRDLKVRYRLDEQIPEFCVSGTLEHDERTLAPELASMRQRLTNIEQGWSRYAAGTLESLPALREEIAKFRSTARELGHYRMVRLLDIVALVVGKLPNQGVPRNESLFLEMAAAFLFMESMLDNFMAPPRDIDQQVAVMAGWLLDAVKVRTADNTMSGTPRDDVTQRQNFADVRSQVVTEIQENLLRVEEIVEHVARDPAQVQRIGLGTRHLAQAAGALKMLGLNRANGVLSACAHLLRLCSVTDPGSTRAALEWTADGLSCLGFYLDAVRRGMAPNDDLLADFVRRLANDPEPAAGSTGWIPAAIDSSRLVAPAETTASAAADTAPAPDVSAGDGATRTPTLPGPVSSGAPPEAVPGTEAGSAHRRKPDESPEPVAVEAAAPGDDEPDPSLLPVFLREARVLLGRLYAELAAWRSAPRDIRAARAFTRTLHTLKGSARLVGAMRLGDYAHGVESYVGDNIERSEREDDSVDFGPLQQMLGSIDDQIRTLAPLHPREGTQPAEERDVAAAQVPSVEIQDVPASVRVPITVLNGLVTHAGELSEVRARTEDEVGTLRRSLHELAETVVRLRAQLLEVETVAKNLDEDAHALATDPSRRPAPTPGRPARVEELGRAMAESICDIQALQQSLVVNCAETEAALALQGRLDRNLRHRLLELRRLPFGTLAERLRRTVQQTAMQLGRDAQLVIEGDSAPIDRTVLQRLAAPLEHMLRNAVAHGIEPTALRVAAGKPATGTIRLVVEQNEDENLLMLSDDGAGLDMASIAAQAAHLGLVPADQTVSDRMLCSLIFAPGLSTAGTLTPASGRGIGLDAVRAEVRALGGSIEASSERARGACFRIRLPTSLSYTQALLVRAAGARYAIPATIVAQVCELSAGALLAARSSTRLQWQSQTYRFAELSRLLGDRGPVPPPRRSNSVLLLRGDGEHTALHVEQVLRKQAIELKNIGPQLARVRGIAGATIVGKGEVVLILDPDELIMHAPQRLAREAQITAASGDARAQHVVLIADDSLTVRYATSQLLGQAGYRVLVARDGVEALRQIEETLPDLVIADIEMPNMDGFELTKHLHSDPRTTHVPILVVTSRSAEEQRRRATELGAAAFLGKPYAAETLLAEVAALLARRTPDAV